MVKMIAAWDKQVNIFTGQIAGELAARMRREAAKVVGQVQRASQPQPTYLFNIGGRFSERYIEPGPGEEILILFDHRREVAVAAMAELQRNAPTESGNYARSFKLHVNGQEAQVADIRAGRRVEIINEADYARRLEVGKNADGSAFSVRGYGLMERTASKVLQRRFGRLAKLYFAFRDLEGAYVLRGAQVGTTYTTNLGTVQVRRNDPGRRAGDYMRYPTLGIGERDYVLQ